MSETTDTGTTPSQGEAPRKRLTSLNGMLLADLKAVAGGLGIKGAGSMKKAQLIEAIKAYQDDASPAGGGSQRSQRQRNRGDQGGAATGQSAPQESAQTDAQTGAQQDGRQAGQKSRRQRGRQGAQEQTQAQNQSQNQGGQPSEEARKQDEKSGGKGSSDQQNQGQNQGQKQNQKQKQQKQGEQQDQKQDQKQGQQDQKQNRQQADRDDSDDAQGEEEGGSRRNRRRRGRERNAGRGRNEPDTTVLEDDVLVPAAGILDVLDNYAFVRTSGYLPGTDDVYLSLSMVRKYGLRRGDAVAGQVRQPREGERREKFNPMVRIDSVNGVDPEAAKERPEFDQFTPVHPNVRLRLETGPDAALGRIVDIVAPIGKGQRALVLSPPRSGKTQVLRSMAEAIRHNNPECHVMVVLIDERPEEVTDYQRSIRGEVVASTFDRPAADHVLLAELAVERAKRLVELGHDVVVLLDSLTRLARAYNVTGPSSGRVGHSGVDAVALHPAKRLFGAARNVEDGGSLTILATALVESGSPLDEAVLDEFNDTANMELRLRRELAERRVYPPVDVVASGTRREEHLIGPEEEQITWKLRTALMDLEPDEALNRVVARMNRTQTNVEFLTEVQKASSAELAKG